MYGLQGRELKGRIPYQKPQIFLIAKQRTWRDGYTLNNDLAIKCGISWAKT